MVSLMCTLYMHYDMLLFHAIGKIDLNGKWRSGHNFYIFVKGILLLLLQATQKNQELLEMTAQLFN